MSPIKKTSEVEIEDAPQSADVPSEAYPRDYEQNMRPRTADQATEVVAGILDIKPEGHGFLRPKFRPSERDINISSSQIRRFWLRNGDFVEGLGRPPKDNERYYGLLKIEKINGKEAREGVKGVYFEDLTPIYPNKQLVLSTKKVPFTKDSPEITGMLEGHRLSYSTEPEDGSVRESGIYVFEMDKDDVLPVAFQNPELKLLVVS